MAKKRKKQCLE